MDTGNTPESFRDGTALLVLPGAHRDIVLASSGRARFVISIVSAGTGSDQRILGQNIIAQCVVVIGRDVMPVVQSDEFGQDWLNLPQAHIPLASDEAKRITAWLAQASAAR